MQMTEQERNDIICALEIAAEQYRKDAVTCAGQAHLPEQFIEQAERAEKLIDKLIR